MKEGGVGETGSWKQGGRIASGLVNWGHVTVVCCVPIGLVLAGRLPPCSPGESSHNYTKVVASWRV